MSFCTVRLDLGYSTAFMYKQYKRSKSVKIGKHCRQLDNGTLYFKDTHSDDISKALQLGIAYDCLRATHEEREEKILLDQDFQVKKKYYFPKETQLNSLLY